MAIVARGKQMTKTKGVTEIERTGPGRIRFPLYEPHGSDARYIELVGGPGDEPYLWIGEEDGDTFAVTVSIGQMRLLRDSLTAALRAYDRRR